MLALIGAGFVLAAWMISQEIIRRWGRNENTPHIEEINVARYLGNMNTKEVHNLDNEKSGCEIAKIKPEHKRSFDSLPAAKNAGYDNCAHCIGSSAR